MRIRSTKPEFWRSERIASVSWDARLVLKGLESYVDDNGVGKDDLALIVPDIFPRDLSRNPTGTLQKVQEALAHLSEAGLLWRYEADGTKLIYVAFWESVQRIEKPTRGRFPRPDGTMNYRDSVIRESSGNPPGTLPEPSGLEQGNRGTGEQVNTSPSGEPMEARKSTPSKTPNVTSDDPRWLTFWLACPRKDGKSAAFHAWRNAVLGTGKYKGSKILQTNPDVILAGIQRYAERVRRNGTDTQHIKMPQGWINERRWEDEAEPVTTVADEQFRNLWGTAPSATTGPDIWGIGA